MKSLHIYRLLCLHVCDCTTVFILSAVRVAFWLVHFGQCNSHDLVHVVFLLHPDIIVCSNSLYGLLSLQFRNLIFSPRHYVDWPLVANEITRSQSGHTMYTCPHSRKIDSHPRICIDSYFSGTVQRRTNTSIHWGSFIRHRRNAIKISSSHNNQKGTHFASQCD